MKRYDTIRSTCRVLLFFAALLYSTTAAGQSISWQRVAQITLTDFEVQILATPDGDLYTTPDFFTNTSLHSTDVGKTWETNPFKVRSAASTPDGKTLLGTNKGIFQANIKGWLQLSTDVQNDSIDNIIIHSAGEWFVRSGLTIYTSTDGGKTWNESGGLDFLEQYPYVNVRGFDITPSGTLVASIDIVPSGESIVNDSTGIYRSVDGGKTWTLTPFNVKNITDGGFMVPRLFHISGDGTIFTGIQTLQGQGQLYRSTDDGDSWVSTSLHDVPVSMAHTPDGTLFASAANSGVYRSLDRGKTWTPVNSGLFEVRVFPLAMQQDGYLIVVDVFGNVSRTEEPVYSTSRVPSHSPHSLSVYPNLTGDYVNVQIEVEQSRTFSLTLYDQLGRIIRETPKELFQPGQYHRSINTADLPSGTYHLVLNEGEDQGRATQVVIRR
ncbi:MAG: T9SS type A sorting domain-containing protein [Ignavibacteriae bacterium]|nr:T9SS type A sorting domain-containing protein [Ignavibacteriota bacterium]MCB9215135.1 T9SS type A sorting domain-containing protein [Ignavibacteria bacterium]